MLANIPVCETESESVKQDFVSRTETNGRDSLSLSFIFIWIVLRTCVCKRTLHGYLLQPDACFLGRAAWYANQQLWEIQISQAEWIFCRPKDISKLIAKLPYDTVVKQVSNLPKVTLLVNAGPETRASFSGRLPITPHLASDFSLLVSR